MAAGAPLFRKRFAVTRTGGEGWCRRQLRARALVA